MAQKNGLQTCQKCIFVVQRSSTFPTENSKKCMVSARKSTQEACNCDIVGLLQESKRPLPRKLQKKSEKAFPGLSAPGFKKLKKAEKKLKKGRKLEKNLKNCHFRLFFGVFRPRGRDYCPGNPFSDFFRSFLGRGLFDSCRRPTMLQACNCKQKKKSCIPKEVLSTVKG